jgi:hypothetical protein
MNEEGFRAALMRLYNEGCPMAMPEMRDRCIDVGVRYWRSFEHRDSRPEPTRDDRIDEVARALWQTFENRGRPPGPEMRDYRGVAEALAEVLDPQDAPAARGR